MSRSQDAMKTHKGAAKRFRIGARGRIKAAHSCASHLKSGKGAKRRRHIRRGTVLSGALAARVRALVRGG